MPQPSKGDRELVGTRLPRPISERVRQRASEAGLTLSDYIGAILTREVGMADSAQAAQQPHLPVKG